MSKRNVQGLVEKSIKTFFERRKKVLTNGKVFWVGRLNITKMSIFPKLIYKFNVISVKINLEVFCQN